MKRLLWNIRFAAAFHKATRLPWAVCWADAKSGDDLYEDELSPQDAVDVEISYWDYDNG